MTLTEKAAYLKGLMEGLSLDETKPETKVLTAMADLLSDIAATCADLENDVNDAKDYLDELDDDLADVEDIVYDDEEEYDEEYDDEDYEDEDDDEMFVEVECPYCSETVYFDETVDPENIICPACNRSFSCICDECDGDCEECDSDCADLAALDGDEE